METVENILECRYRHIDVASVVPSIIEDTSVYLDAAAGFASRYRDFFVDEWSEENRIVIHSIKGVSAMLGAKSLHLLAASLEKNREPSLKSEFNSLLREVVAEFETMLSKNRDETPKIELDDRELLELSNELLEALKSRRPKLIDPLVERLKGVRLEDEWEWLNELVCLAKNYEFEKAIALAKKEIGDKNER